MTVPYIHLNLIVLDEKYVWVTFDIMTYTDQETTLECPRHTGMRRKLFQNGDVRCFQCIPWGNRQISYGFKRIGVLVSSIVGVHEVVNKSRPLTINVYRFDWSRHTLEGF